MEHCCPLQNKAMDENPSPANGIAESKPWRSWLQSWWSIKFWSDSSSANLFVMMELMEECWPLYAIECGPKALEELKWCLVRIPYPSRLKATGPIAKRALDDNTYIYSLTTTVTTTQSEYLIAWLSYWPVTSEDYLVRGKRSQGNWRRHLRLPARPPPFGGVFWEPRETML